MLVRLPMVYLFTAAEIVWLEYELFRYFGCATSRIVQPVERERRERERTRKWREWMATKNPFEVCIMPC